jgi:hypothetical protein
MSFLAKLMTNAAPGAGAITAPGGVTAVGIRVNAGDIVYLQPEKYTGKSVAQLFADNAAELGISATQVTKFTNNGSSVAGTDAPQPGAVYQGATQTMQKG